MLKVLAIVDKANTALDRLAQSAKPYNDNLDYKVLAVHPKRPDANELANFEIEAANADIIDFLYFRSAQMLLEKYPWLRQKKLILTHHNPYSIKESMWDDFDQVVACNETIRKALIPIMHDPAKRLSHIPLATNPLFWKFNFDWKPTKRVIMVANRIEAKKGILPVAIACGELGLTFVLVGAISDRMYFESILQTGNVEFHEQITDEKLRELYYGAGVHVCNSIDNFESGTMPILEAMQCGTPVLTRMVGHVPDLYNGENLTILEGQPEDVAGIQDKLEDMLNDPKILNEQREKAWNTAKNYNSERRAYSYQRLYRKVLGGEPVSVIVPIYDKPDVIRACLTAIAEQDYANIELIVVDDNELSNQELVDRFREVVNFPVRYINVARGDSYGLSRARNIGIIESCGDVLVFCDQRQIMAPNAISEFVKNLVPKTWLFGEKGGNKKNFVENFSAISRTDLINAGMFNERIDRYGGMSQELRERCRAQGIKLEYCPNAKATPLGKSNNKFRKKDDILAMKNLLWRIGF